MIITDSVCDVTTRDTGAPGVCDKVITSELSLMTSSLVREVRVRVSVTPDDGDDDSDVTVIRLDWTSLR